MFEVIGKEPMAIVVFFNNIQNCPTEKYYETLRRLETAGAGSPKGQLYHIMHETDGRPHGIDVSDSMENFETFGRVLLPCLAEQGIEAGEPVIMPGENVQAGWAPLAPPRGH